MQLTARGWEVTIATTLGGDHAWLPLFTESTPDVFALHRFLRLTDYPRFLKYLIQSRRPDVVMVSNSELGYLLLPYLRACAPETTFVDYTHMEEEHWKSGGYPRLAVEYQGFLDANVTSSHHLKQWMVTRGANADRTVVCHTGVDIPPADLIETQRKAKRSELAVPPGHPIILYAGRICQQKQPKVFAETMRRLAADGVPYTAIVAGTGPDFDMLSSFVAKHDLESRVRFVGAVPPSVMYELIAASDIFFLPSEWEGIALAIHEAMAHGRVVVGADVGGQRELVTPECGVLISRGGGAEAEAERYAAVLAPLLADERVRRDMGMRSRARIEAHYQVDQFGERMLAVLAFAQNLHRTDPRPVIVENLSRVAATNAIEYLRLQRVADELWAARHHMPTASQHTAVPQVRGLRGRVFRACSILEPAYSWGIRRGWHWLPPLRQRVRDTVLGQ
jgi:glycosyltransferase involved in cell wall biosynthesis